MREHNYNTKQKDDVLNFFVNNSNQLFSIKELNDLFITNNVKIGLTTIYRILNKLTMDNQIITYLDDNEKRFGYFNCCCDDYYHLICVSCGKVEHIDKDIYIDFKEKVNLIHGFELNTDEKFLEGRCSKCI